MIDYDLIDKITHTIESSPSQKFYTRQATTSEYSESDFRNDVNNEDDLKRVLGRKWKANLAMLGSFIDKYQYIATRKTVTPFALSSNSRDLIRMFKSQQNAYNFLQTAIDVDLIKCVDEKYRFSIYESYSKLYIYNKRIERLIKDVIAKYSINFIKYLSDKDYSKYKPDETFNFNKEKHYNIGFSPNLRIPNMTDEECINVLHVKYPQLQVYMDKAVAINQEHLCNNPEQLIKFIPNISRSPKGYITGIGIRATNSICNLKVHDVQEGEYGRHEYLCDYFDDDNYYEYDVKSSIYRVSHLVTHGVWVDDDVDFYSEIYGKDFESDIARHDFKMFCQRVYFDSPDKVFNHTRDMLQPLITNKDDEAAIRQQIAYIKQSMEYILGNSNYSSEIFLHESCIYMDLFKTLRDNDINVVQVYDGFYSDQDISSLCKSLLESISTEYYHNYLCL